MGLGELKEENIDIISNQRGFHFSKAKRRLRHVLFVVWLMNFFNQFQIEIVGNKGWLHGVKPDCGDQQFKWNDRFLLGVSHSYPIKNLVSVDVISRFTIFFLPARAWLKLLKKSGNDYSQELLSILRKRLQKDVLEKTAAST